MWIPACVADHADATRQQGVLGVAALSSNVGAPGGSPLGGLCGKTLLGFGIRWMPLRNAHTLRDTARVPR